MPKRFRGRRASKVLFAALALVVACCLLPARGMAQTCIEAKPYEPYICTVFSNTYTSPISLQAPLNPIAASPQTVPMTVTPAGRSRNHKRRPRR
jgi:hypothetical protein